jgi:uncharacterized glyoxalase superfamily protein PhnB
MNSLTPDLMVEDVGETVTWYERVFDADVVATLPSGAETTESKAESKTETETGKETEDPWWVQVAIGDASLMFQERGSLTEKLPELSGESIGGSIALYVDVDDADALHEDLATSGVEIRHEPHETDFGWRQFAATDPNGYVLWFGEKLDDGAEDIGRRHRSLVRRHHG